ncbi:MAG: FAD-dependent oxidoreductase [Planctomycetota bacterium]
MNSQSTVREPQRDIPVIETADVCVIGGSSTGVFAAVRAARLGQRVVLIEKTNAFGGVATNGLVNVWHSNYDTEFKTQIIGGLTMDVVNRLKSRDLVLDRPGNRSSAFIFNSEELKIELDALVKESGVVPFLHASFCAPLMNGNRIDAVLIETKDGRRAIRASMFIDASGDGDLAARCGLPFTVDAHLQPPTTCAKILNLNWPDFNYRALYDAHRTEYQLAEDSGWQCEIPGLPDIQMFAQTHVFGADCSNARQLTDAEMEGRRQVRAVMDIIRKYGPQKSKITLAGLPAYIGIRETRRFSAEYSLTEDDVLSGRRFDDAISNGSYRVDIHYTDKGGFLFKYLDGTSEECRGTGTTKGRWRPETKTNPTYYQIPYRTMVNRRIANLIMAGRMIAADKAAYGAIRVMVNLNQTGEAAGVAAAIANKTRCDAVSVNAGDLRRTLADGGSIIL